MLVLPFLNKERKSLLPSEKWNFQEMTNEVNYKRCRVCLVCENDEPLSEIDGEEAEFFELLFGIDVSLLFCFDKSAWLINRFSQFTADEWGTDLW